MTVTVNGHDLDQDVASGVEGVGGLHHVAGKRGGDIEIAKRHGTLRQQDKRYSASAVVMPIWVRGTAPDGTYAGTDDAGRVAWHERLRFLIGLFTRGELVRVRHTLPDGSARDILGEVTDVLDIPVDGFGRFTIGRFNVGLTCAYPFWTDVVATTQTVTIPAGQSRVLGAFAAGTAPLDYMTLSIGPATNVELRQHRETGGEDLADIMFAYDGTIGTGRHVQVNTGAWTVIGTVDSGGTWNPSTAPTQHLKRVRKGRHPNFFHLYPAIDGAPTLSNTGGSSVTVTITAYQRYLVP